VQNFFQLFFRNFHVHVKSQIIADGKQIAPQISVIINVPDNVFSQLPVGLQKG
jgi:hypothetical protein